MTRYATFEVFTPSSTPTHTYVQRDHRRLEMMLSAWAESAGQIASISGPSKTGKTVLIQRVVGEHNLITVSGASIRSADQLWERVLDWHGEPHSTTASASATKTATKATERGASLGLTGTAASTKGTSTDADQKGETTQATVNRRGLPQVVSELAKTEWTILLDDFHYIPTDIQTEIAQQLKDAASRGLRICVASVPHRADNVVRALPELRGRVMSVDIEYWSKSELLDIARLGFPLLGMSVDDMSMRAFAEEAAGSPQLMQLICQWCTSSLRVRETLQPPRPFMLDAAQRKEAFYVAAQNADYRSLVRLLRSGPRARPDQRKIYQHSSGLEGDVYTTVLRAIAMEPKLSISYADLNDRLDALCNKEGPDPSSVVRACTAMDQIARGQSPLAPALEWEEPEQRFVIVDPYLMFYLRWSEILDRD